MIAATECWPSLSRSEAIAAGEIDVWWLDLAGRQLDESAFRPHLTPTECTEIARFVRAQDRCQRAGARVFLRFVLGTYYLAQPAAAVRWVRDEHARPRLFAETGLHLDFNLSHAGTHILVAVARDRVGVDVETLHDLDAAALARICATPAEREWLAIPASATEMTARFLRLWTMKEAVLKAHGLGLECDPRTCDVLVEAGRAWLQTPGEDPIGFSANALSLDPDIFAAVAWVGTVGRQVSLRRVPANWLGAA